MFLATSCPECSVPLQCNCGTYDHKHESSCDILGGICSNCWAQDLDRVPVGPEPDMYGDHVKEHTGPDLEELHARAIDILAIEHADVTDLSVPVREAISA